MVYNDSQKKKREKALQARRQRSYIKEKLKTTLEDVENISEKKGTDFLITRLIDHALEWKKVYYTASYIENEERNLVRHTEVRNEAVKILQEIEGKKRSEETDFATLVEILMNYLKNYKSIYDTLNNYQYTSSIETSNYVETENNLQQTSYQTYTSIETNSYVETENNLQQTNNQTSIETNNNYVETEPILESFLQFLENDNDNYLFNNNDQQLNNTNSTTTINSDKSISSLNEDNQQFNVPIDTILETEPALEALFKFLQDDEYKFLLNNDQQTNKTSSTTSINVDKSMSSSLNEKDNQSTNILTDTILESNIDNSFTSLEYTIHQKENLQEITTEEEIVLVKKKKRKRTRNKEKHFFKKMKRTVNLIISQLDDMI